MAKIRMKQDTRLAYDRESSICGATVGARKALFWKVIQFKLFPALITLKLHGSFPLSFLFCYPL